MGEGPAAQSSSDLDAAAASSTPPQSAERPPFGSGSSSMSGQRADGDAVSSGEGGGASNGPVPPTNAEMELRAQLEMANARCGALEEQNTALWHELKGEGSDAGSDPFSDAEPAPARNRSPLGAPPPLPPGEDIKAVLAAAAPGVVGESETVEALEKLLAERDDELTFLRERCVQFEVEVEAEFEDLSAQLFEAQQRQYEQQQALTESEAKRKQMEGSKQMLEAKLQDAGLQLMECERQLAEAVAAGGGPKSRRSPSSDSRRGSLSGSPGTPPSSDPRPAGHPFFNNILEDEVEQLKEENRMLMEELVLKKMALAELSESHAKLKRDLHRRAERDKAVTTKMSRIHAIMNGTAPLNSLTAEGTTPRATERGHLMANSPSAASLSRRLSQASGENSPHLAAPPLPRPSRPSSSSGGTPFQDRDFVRPWR